MATTGKQFGVGMRRAVVFALNTSGLPSASGTTAYEGLEVVGPRAWNLNNPEPRKITHVGNDRPLAIDYLPPNEAMSAELRVAAGDLPLQAVLTNVNTFTIADATLMQWNTEQQGSEPDVGLLLFQQSLDTATKARRYRFHVIPSGRVYPQPANMDENAAEHTYMVAPNPTTTHLWGTTMAVATEGGSEAAAIEGMTTGRPNIVAFLGDASTVAFLFPTAKQAINTTSIAVWVDGVLQTGGGTDYTGATSGITFVAAPANNALIVAFYEY